MENAGKNNVTTSSCLIPQLFCSYPDFWFLSFLVLDSTILEGKSSSDQNDHDSAGVHLKDVYCNSQLFLLFKYTATRWWSCDIGSFQSTVRLFFR